MLPFAATCGSSPLVVDHVGEPPSARRIIADRVVIGTRKQRSPQDGGGHPARLAARVANLSPVARNRDNWAVQADCGGVCPPTTPSKMSHGLGATSDQIVSFIDQCASKLAGRPAEGPVLPGTIVTTGRKRVDLEFNRGIRTASFWPTRISFNRMQEFRRVSSPPPPAVGRSPIAVDRPLAQMETTRSAPFLGKSCVGEARGSGWPAKRRT